MGDSYAELFLNSALARGDALSPLSLLFLFFARFLPIMSQAPFLGARVLPGPVKITFAISMFVVFLPTLLTATKGPIPFDSTLIVLMLKEFFIGLLIGYMINMPFVVVQTAGLVIDHQRGGASLMVNDPTIQNQSSPLGTLFNYMLIWLFFFIDAPFIVFELISTSYTIIAPDQFFNPDFFRHNTAFWTIQITLFNKVMVLAMQLATPALLAILMTDVFLGIANRLAPQVQITFLGMPLKSLLALAVVCFGLKIFAAEVVRQSYLWLAMIQNLVSLMQPMTAAAGG
jgi:type III secretory pathway component EscT